MTILKETLKSKFEIKTLFKTGKKFYQKSLTIYFFKNSKDQFRFLYCSDKSARNSVQRNRVKRVLRALIHEIDFSGIPSCDIAIIAKFSFTEMSYIQRKNILTGLVSKIKDE